MSGQFCLCFILTCRRIHVRAGVLCDLKNSEDQEEIRWEFPGSFDRHSTFLFHFQFRQQNSVSLASCNSWSGIIAVSLSHWAHFTVRRFVYILCVFVSHCIVVVLLWARWGWPDGIEVWSLGTSFLQCSDTVGWVTWSVKIRPRYDLWCVWWDVKPVSYTHLTLPTKRIV